MRTYKLNQKTATGEANYVGTAAVFKGGTTIVKVGEKVTTYDSLYDAVQVHGVRDGAIFERVPNGETA